MVPRLKLMDGEEKNLSHDFPDQSSHLELGRVNSTQSPSSQHEISSEIFPTNWLSDIAL